LPNSTSTAKYPNAAAVIRQVSALVNAGLPAHQVEKILSAEVANLAPLEAKQFGLVWKLATKLGGPIVLTLNRITDVFERKLKNQNEVHLAFAGPQATAKLVMWLPILALVLAQLVGMNPFAAIFGSLLGGLSVSLGTGLMVAGRQWTRRLLSRALPSPDDVVAIDRGAFLDCVLIGLQAGLPLDQAKESALAEFENTFLVKPLQENFVALTEAAELSRNTGAALTAILFSKADAFREEQRFEIATRISKLGVQLMIPIGVAVLPAFVLLSIVPIAISLLSNGQL
jgi:tight adherence protein B